VTLTTNLGHWQVVTIVLTLALGLAVDVRIDIVGQALLSAAIWAVMFCLLARFAPHERYVLMACLTIATAGELVLSLAWGLYTYRLGNVPLFVPPGHVLLLMLGLWLARWISDRRAQMVIGCAGLYALAVIGAGLDTLAGPLFLVVVVAWIVLPAHQRLYASTFLLSLVLELYGTWLGNWSWALAVPGMPLVTTNPPGTVGAFYCALDALVVAATVHVLPRMRACTA
jgi:hypothetical protein